MCSCDYVYVAKTNKSFKIRSNKRVLEIKYKIHLPKLKFIE